MKSRYKSKTKVLIGVEIFALILLVISSFTNTEYTLVFIILIILLLYNLKSMADMVIVEKDGIVVKNWFTMEKRQYGFDQFDTVVKHVDPVETLGRLDLFLLKDRLLFCKIQGRNYANVDDLMLEIEDRKRGN